MLEKIAVLEGESQQVKEVSNAKLIGTHFPVFRTRNAELCFRLQLEAECLRLREELAAESIRHQKELERISRESSQSRERLMQLERKSREEFQAQVDAKTAVIDSLQKQIDQKVKPGRLATLESLETWQKPLMRIAREKNLKKPQVAL